MIILSPAKINLFLYVTGKRQDGYHNVVTLMSKIGIYDRIRLDFAINTIRVKCSHDDVPEDINNLAFRAAILFYKAYGKKGGALIRIDKQIPVGAGLGGGSSNAAAVLKGLNSYYGFPLTNDELVFLSLSIGTDVPFFLQCKPALARGKGEIFEPFKGLPQYYLVIVYPGFGVSTKEIYKKLNLGLTKGTKTINKVCFNNEYFDAYKHLHNDLENVVLLCYPEIKCVKKALINHGAKGVLMSGSGSSVFGLFSKFRKASDAAISISKNSKWRIFLSNLLL